MDRTYTPIHHLIKKRQQELRAGQGAEMMPVSERPPIEYKVAEEHTITDPSVKSHIEERPETVAIPEEVKKVGVKAVSAPKFVNYAGVKLPLDEEKIPAGLNAPVDSSFKWLATLARYILEQSQSTIQKAHRGVTGAFKK